MIGAICDQVFSSLYKHLEMKPTPSEYFLMEEGEIYPHRYILIWV